MNQDDTEAGLEDHPDYEVLRLAQQEMHPNADSCYKSIELDDMDDLLARTRLLDEDQQLVLQEAVSHAKALVIARNNQTIPPEAPKIMVHGGAGCGKSTVIKVIVQWMEHILRTAGDDPTKPYILVTASTGAAAAQIDGVTLFSALGFHFGNAYYSMSDKVRDQKRAELCNLRVLILDEV